jgi:hypothetical protein
MIMGDGLNVELHHIEGPPFTEHPMILEFKHLLLLPMAPLKTFWLDLKP